MAGGLALNVPLPRPLSRRFSVTHSEPGVLCSLEDSTAQPVLRSVGSGTVRKVLELSLAAVLPPSSFWEPLPAQPVVVREVSPGRDTAVTSHSPGVGLEDGNHMLSKSLSRATFLSEVHTAGLHFRAVVAPVLRHSEEEEAGRCVYKAGVFTWGILPGSRKVLGEAGGAQVQLSSGCCSHGAASEAWSV